jgi:hypothetical protein
LQRSQPDQEQRERRGENARGKPSQDRCAENRREECLNGTPTSAGPSATRTAYAAPIISAVAGYA